MLLDFSRIENDMRSQKVVLVAEDEPALVDIFRRALEREGYRVLTAEDGRHALAVLEEKRAEIDLLLSDIVMPGMGGRELVWLIRDKYPHIKVILASGYTNERGALQMMEDGGVAFVAKPVDLGILVRLVGEVLGDS